MSDQLRSKCKTLRLAHIAEIYDQIPFENKEQYLNDLFDEEHKLREHTKSIRLIKNPSFWIRRIFRPMNGQNKFGFHLKRLKRKYAV